MIMIGFFSSGDDMTLINYTSVHKTGSSDDDENLQ